MKIFFDTEFTGLHQQTTLISIGMVAENGNEFYGILTDYDEAQVNNWIRENVIANLELPDMDGITECRGNQEEMAGKILDWLLYNGCDKGENKARMWSDCLAYDWVLFNQLWGHAFNLPEYIHYIPFDICTLFEINGIDPDINREDFSGFDDSYLPYKHNALWDAQVIKACYEKLMQ